MRHPGAPIGDAAAAARYAPPVTTRGKKAPRHEAPEYDSDPVGGDDGEEDDDEDDYDEDDEDDDVGRKRKAPVKRAAGPYRAHAYHIFCLSSFSVRH